VIEAYSNPFSKYRAEQMGDSAWKYFVEPSREHVGAKPLIFEASRGTGKTMFLKCNSWREKFEEAKSTGKTLREFLNTNKHLGFYYKADGRFVKSLTGKTVEDSTWIGIFNTYFNVEILKTILPFLKLLIDEGLITKVSIEDAINLICLRLKKEKAKDLSDLKLKLDEIIISIEQFSNNTKELEPVGLNAGTVIEDLLKAVKETPVFNGSTFHVFIDEYEELTANQQVQLNTLLKRSDASIVYDFGVITKGILTYKTVSGQEIRPRDDFQLLITDNYKYYESDNYNNLLIEISKKRLKKELDKSGKTYEEKYLDISYYLKNYRKQYQEELFAAAAGIQKIKDRILIELKRQAVLFKFNQDQVNAFYIELTEGSPIIIRMHLALLMRKKSNAVPANRILTGLKDQNVEYKEWVHNMENAIVYLLCDELNIEKKYHGFKVFSALSSGVVRSFLELAEYAFDYAINNTSNPFNFDSPREITAEEQTKAVYFVSNFKVKEIDNYEPAGFLLKPFIKALGKIFYSIQTNPNNTLGEVEQNHFTTKINEFYRLKPEAVTLYNYALRHKLLEEGEPTKTKSEEIIEYLDLHINHIYCPAFKISHLRKRKITVDPRELEKLLCGEQREIEEVVKRLSKTPDEEAPNLFSQEQ
jgi:hypothetical protein